MTSKIISQNTFDDVLKENIVEFLMSPEEAREETIKQFEAQVVITFVLIALAHKLHVLNFYFYLWVNLFI